MPLFLHLVSYTPEALARLIANPQDRTDAVRGPIEKLGGKIKDLYFAFGEHDAMLITEMPDSVSRVAHLPDHGADVHRRGPGCHA